MDYPEVWILLTTYQRTDYALQTVRGLKQNLIWPNLGWYISDDHSPNPSHVSDIVNEIGPSYQIHTYDSERRGVGHGMNHCLKQIFSRASHVLVMEDDWILHSPLDLSPYVNMLTNKEDYGMVRFGYMATNLLLYTISEENRIIYRVEPNQETYRFTGHPSLRHKRFHEYYGWYDEGFSPGMTELSMCGKTNARNPGPHIVIPGEFNCNGAFHHIGSVSLADTPVGR